MKIINRAEHAIAVVTTLMAVVTCGICFADAADAAKEQSSQGTSVCDIVADPDSYNDTIVRLHAHVLSDGIERISLVDKDCPQGISLLIPRHSKKNSGISELWNALYKRGNPGAMEKEIDGTFEGRFEWRPKEKWRTRVLMLKKVSGLTVNRRVADRFSNGVCRRGDTGVYHSATSA